MRGAMLVLFLAACSSEPQAPPPDLAIPPGCTYVWSGDWSGMRVCRPRFCRGSTTDGLDIQGEIPPDPELVFGVDGAFMPGRSYTASDLTTFIADGRPLTSTVSYVAGKQVIGSSVTLTLTDVEWNANDSCPTGGIVHGTAHVVLVESPTDGGTTTLGRVMLDATF